MEDFLQKQLEKLQQDYMALIQMRVNASVDARGGILHQLQRLEMEMEEVKKDLQKWRAKTIAPILDHSSWLNALKVDLEPVKQLLSRGKMAQAIALLKEVLPQESLVTALNGRYSHLQTQIIAGTLSTETQFQQMAKLNYDILEFINLQNG
ncbi:MAG: Effector-associated domain 11 [Bacteroidota bacterium]